MNYRIIAALVVIILGLSISLKVVCDNKNKVITQLSVATNNLRSEQEKTLSWKDKDSLNHSKSIQQELTIAELKRSNSYATSQLKSLSEKYGISLSKLKAYAEVENTIKYDTIISIDSTILGCHDLSNKNIGNLVCIKLDSLKRYNLSSIITIDSKDSFFWTSKKQTINSPRKFFLWRLFQKKYEEINVEIIHGNPLIQTKSQTFTIIK